MINVIPFVKTNRCHFLACSFITKTYKLSPATVIPDNKRHKCKVHDPCSRQFALWAMCRNLNIFGSITHHASTSAWWWLQLCCIVCRSLKSQICSSSKCSECSFDLSLHDLWVVLTALKLSFRQAFPDFIEKQSPLLQFVTIPVKMLRTPYYIGCNSCAVYNVEEYYHRPARDLSFASLDSYKMIKIVYTRFMHKTRQETAAEHQ